MRLVIPAAIAAIGTYLALVRDEMAAESTGHAPARAHDHGHRPSAPAPLPPAVATRSVPAAPPAPAPAVHTPAPPPTPPSPYVDLAPAAMQDESTPSVYDLLAGSPGDAPEPAAVEERPPVVQERPTWPAVVEHHDEPAPPPPAAHEPVASVTEPEVELAPDRTPPTIWERVAPPSEPVVPVAPASASSDSTWQITLDEGRFALGGWAASAGHSMVSAVTFRRRLAEDITADRIVLEVDASDNVPDGGLVVLADPGFAPDRDGFTLLLAAADPGPFSAAGSYRVLGPKQ